MKTLVSLLEKFEGPLTADFQRFYSLRLSDAVVDRTEDEVLDLVYWLPQESAFIAINRANGDRKKGRALHGWESSHDMLLGMLNLIRHQTYVIEQTSTQKRIQKPTAIPNPSESPSAAKAGSRQDANSMARMFLQAQKG